MSEHRHRHHSSGRAGSQSDVSGRSTGRRHHGRQQSSGSGRSLLPRRRGGCLEVLIVLLLVTLGLMGMSLGWFSGLHLARQDGDADSIEAPGGPLPAALPAPGPHAR